MLETIVAFPVLFSFFATAVQLAYVMMADLFVQHAAVAAARSASVLLADLPMAYKDQSPVGTATGDRLAKVTEAASKVVEPLKDIPFMGDFNPNVTVKLLNEGRPADKFAKTDVIQAKVDYEFTCAVPFGGSIICGLKQKMDLTSIAAMPNHGADYAYF